MNSGDVNCLNVDHAAQLLPGTFVEQRPLHAVSHRIRHFHIFAFSYFNEVDYLKLQTFLTSFQCVILQKLTQLNKQLFIKTSIFSDTTLIRHFQNISYTYI